MTPQVYEWARRHGLGAQALHELQQIMGLHGQPGAGDVRDGMSESAVSSRVRLAKARAGGLVWRNNVGAMQDDSGRVVRYGLANESKQENERIKSSDLVGVTPTLITPAMVGSTIGQAWFRETKEAGWYYTGTPRERAQLNFIELTIAHGCDAAFSTGGI